MKLNANDETESEISNNHQAAGTKNNRFWDVSDDSHEVKISNRYKSKIKQHSDKSDNPLKISKIIETQGYPMPQQSQV